MEICYKKPGECNPFRCDLHLCINQDKKEKPIQKKIFEKNPDIICKTGHLIKSECRISANLIEWARAGDKNAQELFESTTFKAIVGEITRSLKASSILAFNGHYRSAMDLFRASIEVYVTARYYDSFEDKNGNQWLEGEISSPNFRHCLNHLRDTFAIPRESYDEIDSIYGRLNKYVHPHAASFSIAQEGCEKRCPVDGFYNNDLINEWFDHFQILMKWILTHYSLHVPRILDDSETKELLETASLCLFDKA